MGQKSKETPIELKNIIFPPFPQRKTENVTVEIIQKPRTTIHYVMKM